MAVDLQHLVGAVVDDDVARRGAAVAGHEHAVGELEGQDRRGLRLDGRDVRPGSGSMTQYGARCRVEAVGLQQRGKVPRVARNPFRDQDRRDPGKGASLLSGALA